MGLSLTSISTPKPLLVLFGPPGSGKGTFSQHIKDRYGYAHLSVGDLVREEIDKQSEIGAEAEECLRKGEFLKESTIQNLVVKVISPLIAHKKSFILDGFPRTPESVIFLQDLFRQHGINKKVLLIEFKAKDITCEERILSRAICKKCSHVFNLQFCRPKKENQCDLCESSLKVRSNDTREIVKKRLEDYHLVTEKACEIAKRHFSSVEFDTDVPLDACFQNYNRFFNES